MTRSRSFLSFLFLLSSCAYSPEEYIHFVETSKNYVKEHEADGFILRCAYRPQGYLALQECLPAGEKGKEVSVQLFEKTKKMFSNGLYFTLKISAIDSSNVLMMNVKSQQEYSWRLNYLSNEMTNDFYVLTAQGDTIKSLIYEYQRSYGNSPDAYFIFSFPEKKIMQNGSDEIELIYQDKILGLSRLVRWKYSMKEIKKQPKIKFQYENL